jgi:hypothetical protein
MSTDTDEKLNVDDDVRDTLYEEEDEASEAYRSMSKMALCSLVMACLALTGLMFPALLSFALFGIVFGILAWRNLRRYPDELTGWTAATVGLVGSAVLLVGGSIGHAYVYSTEVPDGYARISFADLQEKTDPQTGQSQLATELDGQRVFVKGYVHPGVANTGRIKKFVLVPDMGTCCFGGQPKLTDMIEVTIRREAPGVQYSQRKRKLGGILHVSQQLKQVAGGLQGGLYELDADYVK